MTGYDQGLSAPGERYVIAANGVSSRGTEPAGAEPGPSWDSALVEVAHRAWQAVAAMGVFSIVLGVLMLVWPRETLIVAGVLLGLYLLTTGVLQLVAAFGTHVSTSLRVLAFVSGALSVLLGVLCFRNEWNSVLLLALWIGIGWLFRGMAYVVAAISDRSMPARGWQAFLGLVTIAAGIVMIDAPFRSLSVLTIVIGWILVGLGIMEILTALRLRRANAMALDRITRADI
ncbi:MAG: HdeD family acid-resistance protein [Mycobacteriaceae bacterium]|nr:HdeD family acid-resistance protein [Mycobacteriaceae bacterium]